MRILVPIALFVAAGCAEADSPPAGGGDSLGGGEAEALGGQGGDGPGDLPDPGDEGEGEGPGAGNLPPVDGTESAEGDGGEAGEGDEGDEGDEGGGDEGDNPRAGGFGTDCEDHDDCFSEFCIQTPAGRQCTVQCTEACPRDWNCRTLANGAADATSLCFPPDPVLCESCARDDDCGGASDLCLEIGRGAYCGVVCSDARPCAEDYECVDLEDARGVVFSRQCAPSSGSCAPCEDGDGDGYGQGGDCLGPDCDDSRGSVHPGAPELCNRRDDDCDLEVDELFDFETDIAHCGGCGRVCAPAQASAVCEAGECVMIECDEGFHDVDGEQDNGCEYGCNPEAVERCDATVVRHQDGVVVLDGNDEDCDGVFENGFRPDGDGRELGEPCGVGPCAGGMWECADDGQGLRCSTELGGSEETALEAELCNGIDDTCSGSLQRIEQDRDGDGWIECVNGPADVQWGDCDDDDWNSFPDARERCDNRDNDCDDVPDRIEFNWLSNPVHCGGCATEDTPEFNCRIWFENRDGHVQRPTCRQGRCAVGACRGGWHDINGDPTDGCEYACEPTADGVEICDGLDNDCDGRIDAADGDLLVEPCELHLGVCADLDKPRSLCVDGQWTECEREHYAAWSEFFEEGDEVRCDDFDNDCDGEVNEWLSTDFDGDGHYTPGSCAQPADDCDDRDPERHPGFDEICDGKDNDCDQVPDDGLSTDFDNDGHYTPGSCFQPADDCDDRDSARHPLYAEICDGKDNDCDGVVDDGLSTDRDGDGHYTPGSCFQPADDCDDRRGDRHPGRAEICDGVDNDCNHVVDDGLSTDFDGDGHYAQGSCFEPADDCDDRNRFRYPGNSEVCDGHDNDCNGSVDPHGAVGCRDYFRDVDNDSYGVGGATCMCSPADPIDATQGGDCYDANGSARPSQGGWFTIHRGDGSYDYNCDSVQQRRWSAAAGTCRFFGDFCDGGDGFSGGAPSCGGTRDWISDCYYSNSGWPWEWGCKWRHSSARTQACR